MLLLHAGIDTTIEVGALGSMDVTPGFYVYVGSAFGPGGLQARVRRHVRDEGTRHWHIDSLRAVTELEEIWYTHDRERRECTWASVLGESPDVSVPLPGFGASDCACTTHLFSFDRRPRIPSFRAQVRRRTSEHAPIVQTDPIEITH